MYATPAPAEAVVGEAASCDMGGESVGAGHAAVAAPAGALVQMRTPTQAMNQLHAIALDRGVQKERESWTPGRELLEKLVLPALLGAAAGGIAAAA